MYSDFTKIYLGNDWWPSDKALEDNLSKYSQIAPTAAGPIEYAMQGEGPVVLAIHGTPGGYDQSLWVCKDITDSGQFTLLSVSRPGYGRTPLSVGKSPAEQADALVSLLDNLGIKKVAAVAFSGGGPTALQLALRHPDRLWALNLTAAVTKSIPSTISSSVKHLTFFNYGIWVWLANFITKYFAKQMLSLMLSSTSTYSKEEKRQFVFEVFKDPSKVEYFKLLIRGMGPLSLRNGLLNDERSHSEIGEYPLENISIPTLIMHGARDKSVPVEHAHYVANKIPNAKEVISLKGCHLLGLDSDYENFIKLRLEFLRKNAPSSAIS